MTRTRSSFNDPHLAASYAENARRNVPGLDDLHHMVMLLLAEQVPANARILVVGAGGGMETLAMAKAQPEWRLTGVDPSQAMLDQARELLCSYAKRVEWFEGTVEQVRADSFDGATSLLTFHHIPLEERLRTLCEIRARLKDDASLIVVEHSAVGPDPQHWLTLSAAFHEREGVDWTAARAKGALMADRLPLVPPGKMESLLEEAGFANVALFYAAFSFRGWVARAA